MILKFMLMVPYFVVLSLQDSKISVAGQGTDWSCNNDGAGSGSFGNNRGQ